MFNMPTVVIGWHREEVKVSEESQVSILGERELKCRDRLWTQTLKSTCQ